MSKNVKSMYVVYDKQGLKSSPIAYYENDVEAYRDLSLSLSRSKQSNPSLDKEDFLFVCVGSFDLEECKVVNTDTYVLDGQKIAKMSSDYIKERFNINVPDGSIIGNKEVRK